MKTMVVRSVCQQFHWYASSNNEPSGAVQVLGRNLEALITAAEAVKAKWGDDFVSVEHMVLAFEDDARFGRQLLRNEGLDSAKLDEAIKAIRGGNRVTDQARALRTFAQGPCMLPAGVCLKLYKLLRAWRGDFSGVLL